jgi:ADP-ribose pyrophosphatase YjhB (NUDIX family)
MAKMSRSTEPGSPAYATDRLAHSVSVGAVVVGPAGVLLVQTTYGPTAGLYSFPGGMVDAAEALDDAAVREVREETGVVARVRGVCAVRTCKVDEVHRTDAMLLMDPVEGTPRAGGEEIADARYFPLEDLASGDVAGLARYVGRLALTGRLRVLGYVTDYDGSEVEGDPDNWRMFG